MRAGSSSHAGIGTHIRVHGLDLLPCRSTQHLDDLHKLVDTRLSREKRLTQHQLSHYTTSRPDVNVGGVVGSSKDELRCSVVSGTDVADIRFTSNQDLGRSKVAELENSSCRVEEKVLWFDITMADSDRVDVGQ